METMKVYHLGYNEGGSEQHLQELMSDPKMLLIDTRLKPYSWRPTWCREDKVLPGGQVIPGLQSQWCERYRWAGKFLGNENYKFPLAPIKIADLDTGLKGLMQYLRKGYSLILMCGCSHEGCHRFKIMRELKAAMPEVQLYRADGTPERLEVEAS